MLKDMNGTKIWNYLQHNVYVLFTCLCMLLSLKVFIVLVIHNILTNSSKHNTKMLLTRRFDDCCHHFQATELHACADHSLSPVPFGTMLFRAEKLVVHSGEHVGPLVPVHDLWMDSDVYRLLDSSSLPISLSVNYVRPLPVNFMVVLISVVCNRTFINLC